MNPVMAPAESSENEFDMAPPLAIQSASRRLQGDSGEASISIEQAWQALLMWARGDVNFVPPFVKTVVLHEDSKEIRKRVHYFADAPNPPPAREQVTNLFSGYLAAARYLDGIFFVALAGIDVVIPSEPMLFLTTIRRMRDPNSQDSAELLRSRAGLPAPGTAGENLARIVSTIRRLITEGEL